MTRAMRVLTGAAMLAVLLGMPLALVWCELACPQELDVVDARPADSAPPAPCHETAAPADDSSSGTGVALTALATSGCAHPEVVTPARAPEAGRAPVPAPPAVELPAHLAVVAPAVDGGHHHPAARGPAPPRGAAVSPVLRL